MDYLIPVNSKKDIPQVYLDTPIGLLAEYHNLGKRFDTYEKAQLLVGMCIDHRKSLIIPGNFAYIIRAGGANLRYSEFKVSYTIAIGGVRHIALIGHNHCGMADITSRKNEFIKGLTTVAGWDKNKAENHFMHYAPMFEIGSEIDFILSETKRLRQRYPGITIAPMFYQLENNQVHFILEDN